MKHIRFLCRITGIVAIALISGCRTVPPSAKVPPVASDATELSNKSGILFDALSGSPAGEYEFARKGNAFVLSVKTARTAGPRMNGAELTYAPYEGLFGGVIGKQKTGYRIKGADDYEHFFIFVHNQPTATLPEGIAAKTRNDTVFLLTVVDKPIYEEIFDSGLELPDAVKKFAPFIRTQALIVQ